MTITRTPQRHASVRTVIHIPGPWHVQKTPGMAWEYQVVSALGTTIANRISQPNARLIAAAPVLLEALDSSLDWLETELNACPEDFDNTDLRKQVEKMKAAIALAMEGA